MMTELTDEQLAEILTLHTRHGTGAEGRCVPTSPVVPGPGCLPYRLAAEVRRQREASREIRASAAELMADECMPLVVQLLARDSYDAISDAVKDYCHGWAQRFRDGES